MTLVCFSPLRPSNVTCAYSTSEDVEDENLHEGSVMQETASPTGDTDQVMHLSSPSASAMAPVYFNDLLLISENTENDSFQRELLHPLLFLFRYLTEIFSVDESLSDAGYVFPKLIERFEDLSAHFAECRAGYLAWAPRFVSNSSVLLLLCMLMACTH